jgi:hypothetical protein
MSSDKDKAIMEADESNESRKAINNEEKDQLKNSSNKQNE